MTKHIFPVILRTVTGRRVKSLRRQGLTPASIFGKKVSTANLQLSTKKFMDLVKKTGESSLIYLQIEGEKSDRPVMVSQITSHPVTGDLLHVSFHQVDLKEKVVASVALKIVGESPAEKDKLGILVQQLDELVIEALPTDMPDHIDVDVSPLSEVGSQITIADLKPNPKYVFKTDPDTTIVKIEALAKEEKEEKPLTTEIPPEVGPTTAPEEETTPTEKTSAPKQE